MGKEIKFRPATFYMGIADMLAREVEGQGREDGEDVRRVSPRADLVELPGEPALQTNDKDSRESKAEKKRAQMVESLDAAGAHVHDPSTSKRSSSQTPSPSPSPPPLESGSRTFSKRDP